MRIFSAPDPCKKIDRSKAWALLLANVFVLPGLGTMAAGHKLHGLCQAMVALAGMVASAAGCGAVAWRYFHLHQVPEITNPEFLIALAGITVFGTAWLWALTTSIFILLNTDSDTRPHNPPTIKS